MAYVNRTTNKLNETTYHVYPNNGAQNYKKDDGTYRAKDLTGWEKLWSGRSVLVKSEKN